ncbi:MAG: thymidine phosphorylase [bacterium]
MRVYDLIYKKRNGSTLSEEEINFLIYGYVNGEIPDSQMAAFLMAVYFKGMDGAETGFLTQAMMSSGDLISLTSIPGVKVDKHSTGGVGDGISLALAPMVAACGVPVAMMAGRGLGHTGGTLDKLEAIPGLKTNLSKEVFVKQVRDIGAAIAGQTEKIAPADKLIYALRDMTATVESIPLIASSIMSKKLACGANAIVLDVKTGNGAFMPDRKDARALAQAMVNIAKDAKREAVAFITNMNQPLGWVVGNSLEMAQTIRVLSGVLKPAAREYPADFVELTLELGAHMLILGKKAANIKEAKLKLQATLDDGSAAKKLQQMIVAQGGNSAVVDDPDNLLSLAGEQVDIVFEGSNGFINEIDTRAIGIASMLLGVGRENKDDEIDYGTGLVLHKKLGEEVKNGDKLATFYLNEDKRLEQSRNIFLGAYKVSDKKPPVDPLIYEVIS